MEKILNYINGEFIQPQTNEWINNIDPSVGKVYSLIPDSNAEDVEKAVQSAEKAFESWSNTSIQKALKYS